LGLQHVLHWQAMINYRVLQHVNVERNVEASRAHRGHLTEDHIFGDAVAVVLLAHRGGFHQDFDGLLEGRPHQCSCIGAIDPMSGDGH
jgi:riboflavin synthase alpha subunit